MGIYRYRVEKYFTNPNRKEWMFVFGSDSYKEAFNFYSNCCKGAKAKLFDQKTLIATNSYKYQVNVNNGNGPRTIFESNTKSEAEFVFANLKEQISDLKDMFEPTRIVLRDDIEDMILDSYNKSPNLN